MRSRGRYHTRGQNARLFIIFKCLSITSLINNQTFIAAAFSALSQQYHFQRTTTPSFLFLSEQSQQEPATQQEINEPSKNENSNTPPSEMKLREIQSELKSMGVSFSDCFDRDSLTKRLIEARLSPPPQQTKDKTSDDSPPSTTNAPSQNNNETTNATPATTASPAEPFNRQQLEDELRALPVRDLKTQLSQKNIRWGNMIEKGDMIRALVDAAESSRFFSSSGELTPGIVNNISGETLDIELNGDVKKLVLLDVYATWCGPCQIIAKEMVGVAEELGDMVRVVKMDSDKNERKAGELRVGGLPTLILFDGEGKELERVEGALMKNDILKFVGKYTRIQ